jgi:hypothetical protein
MMYFVRYYIDDEKWIPLNVLDVKIDKYEISSYGQVRLKNDNYILKTFVSNTGYERVGLVRNNGKRKNYTVHRLIALAFIKNHKPEKYYVVNHIDCDKLYNYYLNLEWTDNSGNMIYSYDLKRSKEGENHHFSKYSDNFIHDICKLLEKKYCIYDIIIKLNILDMSITSRSSTEYQRLRYIIKALRKKKFRRQIVSQYNF